MDDICKECWNDSCKVNEELRNDKIDVCKHMRDYPEEWDERFFEEEMSYD